jgi:TctA family transporter
MLVLLNIPLIGIWVSLLRIPYTILYPAIVVLICVGTYSLRFSTFDVWLVLLFGVVGYGMRLLRFEPAPLLIGFILGPMIEEHFRRAMLLAHGDPLVLLDKPIVATILSCAALIIIANIVAQFRRPSAERMLPPAQS